MPPLHLKLPGMTTPISRPFALTPRSGDQLRALEELAAGANLEQAVTGHHVKETSLGRNLAARLSSAAAARYLAAELGSELSVDGEILGGDAVHVPAMNLFARGHLIRLLPEAVPVGELRSGNYLLVAELWRALVGPTTLGRFTEPAIFAGSRDVANKPSDASLFPAGNVRAGEGPSDAPLATASIVTQKFLQWQYRLSLVSVGDLAAWESDLLPRRPWRAGEDPEGGEAVLEARYAPLAGELFGALIPQSAPDAYARAFDRQLYAGVLARVIVSPAGVRVVQNRLTAPAPGALLLPPRAEMLRAVEDRLNEQQRRIQVLERAGRYRDFSTDEPVNVGHTTAGGVVAAQKVPFADNIGNLDLGFDPGQSTRVVLPRAGRYAVTAGALWQSFAQEGSASVRLWLAGRPTAFGSTVRLEGVASGPVPISVAGEFSAKAGDVLELEVAQNTGALAVLAKGALMSVRELTDPQLGGECRPLEIGELYDDEGFVVVTGGEDEPDEPGYGGVGAGHGAPQSPQDEAGSAR